MSAVEAAVQPRYSTSAGKEVMDFKGVAEYLTISPITARVWVSRRVIPYTKAGRRTLFLKTSIDEWLRENSVKADQRIKQQ